MHDYRYDGVSNGKWLCRFNVYSLKNTWHENKKHAVLNAEIIFGICMTALMSILLVVCTFAVYNVGHTANLLSILGFLIFGSMTMFMFFQVFNLYFGRWSLLIAFPINMMGIFASGTNSNQYFTVCSPIL